MELLLEKVRTPLLILVAACLAILVAWLLTSERRSTRQNDDVRSAEEVEVLRRKSLDLEATFEKARLERTELLPADIDLLAQALAVHEQYILARGAVGSDNSRLDALRRRLHVTHAEQLRMESERLEASALAAAKSDPLAAVKALRRAWECEKEIDGTWVYSGLGEQGRIARIDTRLRRLESEPLWARGRALEKEGDALEAAAKFEEAAAKFNEAMESEVSFLERYRDVRDTEFGRVERLSVRSETALSGNLKRAIDEKARLAEAAEKAELWGKAAEAWQDAIVGFNRLLTQFPRSKHADREFEAKMTRRLNYALFHDDILRVRKGLGRVREQLRTRRLAEAVPLATALLGEVRKLAEKNAGVFLPEDPERRELEFIVEREATLRTLSLTIDQSLVPLPGFSGRMYRQEVTQGLFASLMGRNPSALQREVHPVESVAYAEALQFCERLGWAIGQRVRLPTLSEFTAAAGEVSKVADSKHSWTFENTDGISTKPAGETQPNSLGFNDLIGNVEEWLQVPAEDTVALVAGGSVSWVPAAGLPVKKVNKREKSRTLGFRIVVE